MRLLLLSPPGGGKGTQGRLLSQKYRVPHIATGDMIRGQIAQQTVFGQKIAARIARGQFAPDADMIEWISERLACPDTQDGYILDGFPRDLAQARAFDTVIGNSKLDAVLELRLTEEVMQERLQGRWICPICERAYHAQSAPPIVPGLCDDDGNRLVRRPDDTAEAVRARLAIYEEMTLPLRAYYQNQRLLRPVDATGSVPQVFRAIVQALESHSRGYKNARLEV